MRPNGRSNLKEGVSEGQTYTNKGLKGGDSKRAYGVEHSNQAEQNMQRHRAVEQHVMSGAAGAAGRRCGMWRCAAVAGYTPGEGSQDGGRESDLCPVGGRGPAKGVKPEMQPSVGSRLKQHQR